MSRIFSMFSRNKGSTTLAEGQSEKAAFEYENDRTRLTKSSPSERFGSSRFGASSRRPSTGLSRQQNKYIGSFAPHPAFIRLIRFMLYGLTSLSSLATAGMGIAVVQWYNTHGPVIKPSWGSLIAVIVFGIGTPGVLFGLFLVTPRVFKHGGFGYILNQTKIELIVLFQVAVVWISGALALAVDLRGRENCLWDGYYHFPKPADFNHVCDLINLNVALGYTTFGLTALQMSVVFLFAAYVLLYLDQEALTEPTNDLGGRAYRARLAALAARRQSKSAQRGVGTAGPLRGSPMSEAGPMAGGVPVSSRTLPSEGGPMMSGGRPATARSERSGHSPKLSSSGSKGRRTPPSFLGDEEAGPSSGRRVMEEREQEQPSELAGEGYYGYNTRA